MRLPCFRQIYVVLCVYAWGDVWTYVCIYISACLYIHVREASVRPLYRHINNTYVSV